MAKKSVIPNKVFAPLLNHPSNITPASMKVLDEQKNVVPINYSDL